MTSEVLLSQLAALRGRLAALRTLTSEVIGTLHEIEGAIRASNVK